MHFCIKKVLTTIYVCDIIPRAPESGLQIWVWRSLVARYLGVVEAAGSSPVTQTMKKVTFVYRQRWLFSMISVPAGTGDISSIWYRTAVRWYMPSAYEGTDIISYLQSKYIMRQRRISYRASDISLKSNMMCDITAVKEGIFMSENKLLGLSFEFAVAIVNLVAGAVKFLRKWAAKQNIVRLLTGSVF